MKRFFADGEEGEGVVGGEERLDDRIRLSAAVGREEIQGAAVRRTPRRRH